MAGTITTSPGTDCLYCGYSLVGAVSARCPECGNSIPETRGIAFLPWERVAEGSLPFRFVKTLLRGALRPRRLFQQLRERAEIPIRRSRMLLGWIAVTAFVISVAGSELAPFIAASWRLESPVAGIKVFWWAWRTHFNALEAVLLIWPVAQLLGVVIVASLALRRAQRASGQATPSLENSCVALALLFLPLFAIRTFITFLEVFLLTVSPPHGLFTDGYLDHIMILAYGAALFFVGVAGTSGINRKRMLVATVAYCLGSWVYLFVTSYLMAAATLMLFLNK